LVSGTQEEVRALRDAAVEQLQPFHEFAIEEQDTADGIIGDG
jgi:hypothetical protein